MELDFKEAGESAVYRANNSNLARCYLAPVAKLAEVEQERNKVKGSYMRLLAAVNSGPSWSEALDRAEAAGQDRDRLTTEVDELQAQLSAADTRQLRLVKEIEGAVDALECGHGFSAASINHFRITAAKIKANFKALADDVKEGV